MKSQSEKNSILEYFRPRGKIVCIGKDLSPELEMINDYLIPKSENRLPLLLLTTNTSYTTDLCDQVVIFDSETMIPQVCSLFNSIFLIFIFNSSEEGIFRILGAILASIEFSGSIPIFIDTGKGLKSDQREIFGECYFNLNCALEEGRWKFLILLDSIISSFTPSTGFGFGFSFSDLIRIFGNSKSLFYGLSSSQNLETSVKDAINQVGEKLINALPEKLEGLEAIFLSVTSIKPLSLKTMSDTSKLLTKTFGEEFKIHFSNAIDPRISGNNIVLILTDLYSIEEKLQNSSTSEFINSFMPTFTSNEISDKSNSKDLVSSEISDDERFNVLNKIFSDSEIYIFDDGGLPLFASHRPAGQEVCLYTGLFSAIQSMSSDLIGHTPDHLTAGDKRCVFVSHIGPHNTQLRGVAICAAGFEENARGDLAVSMNLVKALLENGEPEYSVNDKVQGILIEGFQNGSINSLLKAGSYHAS